MGTNAAPPASLGAAEGERLCEAFYWSPVSVETLSGEEDSSFLVEDSAGDRFVLKISSASADDTAIGLQVRVLSQLETVEPGRFPRVVRSRHGRHVEKIEIRASVRRVRMLTYLPGHLLSELPVRPPALLASLGRLLGRLDRTLAGLDEPLAKRHQKWDIARLGEMRRLGAAIAEPVRRRQAERMIERYLERRSAHSHGLQRGLIHGDANDHNVIVSSLDPTAARLVGLIDFGDLVESDRLVELAVAMAYSGLGAADPWSAALPVLGGYHREYPLTGEEIELLFPAVCARLGLSVCVSARRVAEGSADEYALISEAPAWAALDVLAELDPAVAANAARLLALGVSPGA